MRLDSAATQNFLRVKAIKALTFFIIYDIIFIENEKE